MDHSPPLSLPDERRSTTDYLALEALYGAANYKPMDVVLTRGRGVWVWDVDGKRYLDGLSAYSAVNQGHCHPRILAAMMEQASRLTLTSRAFRNDQLGLFYEEICTLTRYQRGAADELRRRGGGERAEGGAQMGLPGQGRAGGRAEIIVCGDNFHGRTLAIVGFSTDPVSRRDFGPFARGFVVVPYGDAAALEAAITRARWRSWSSRSRARPA